MKKVVLIIGLSIIVIMLSCLMFLMVKKGSSKELIYSDLNVTEKDIDVVKSEIDLENFSLVYEMEFYYQNVKYDYKVDMINNVIISIDKTKDNNNVENNSNTNTNNTNTITIEEAKAIALKKAGISADSVRNIIVEEDQENGSLEYEIEFIYDNIKYECTVSNSGEITKFEKERI